MSELIVHIYQERRTAVKSETSGSGSRPATPSAQQSSNDSSSKGIFTITWITGVETI